MSMLLLLGIPPKLISFLLCIRKHVQTTKTKYLRPMMMFKLSENSERYQSKGIEPENYGDI